MMKRKIIAIDIGSRTIKALIGEFDGSVKTFYGVTSIASSGVRNGYITDIEALKESIKRCVNELRDSAGFKEDEVYINISDPSVQTFNSTGTTAVKGQKITRGDIITAMETAQAIAMPPERVLIQSFPQEFTIDNQKGIVKPLGMTGTKLEIEAHIISGSKNAHNNLTSISEKLGLNIAALVFNPLTSPAAILSDEEKEIGVLCIDMGSGTTDISVYCNGKIKSSCSIPFGGNDINRAIAISLSITASEAEKIKLVESIKPASENFEVRREGYNQSAKFAVSELQNMIEAVVTRFIESDLKERISPAVRNSINSVVVTGGSSESKPIIKAIVSSFNVPCRIGVPFSGTDLPDELTVLKAPKYSGAVGLFFYGCSNPGDGANRSVLAQTIRSMFRRYLK